MTIFELKNNFFGHFLGEISCIVVFNFTQFWVGGWPGNTYFWISHIVCNLLASLGLLGLHPQCSAVVWNEFKQFLPQCNCTCCKLENPGNKLAIGENVLGLCTRPRTTVTNTANISTTKYTVVYSVVKFNVNPLHIHVHTYFKTSKAKEQWKYIQHLGQ